MATRYNVELLSTGTYVHGASIRAEEPEWFSCSEAHKLAQAIDNDHGRNVTRVNAVDFSANDEV